MNQALGIYPASTSEGVLLYLEVPGFMSLSEAIMKPEDCPTDTLVRALLKLKQEILGVYGDPFSSGIGYDSLKKSADLMTRGLPDTPELALIRRLVDGASGILAEDIADTEAPALGLGRFVLHHRGAMPVVLVHPGSWPPFISQIGRWIEELGLLVYLFTDKDPRIANRAKRLLLLLREEYDKEPQMCESSALLALGAHVLRRLDGPPAPPGAIETMLDFGRILAHELDSFWSSQEVINHERST